MAVTIGSGIVDEYGNIQFADLFVERPELLRSQIRVRKTAHELYGFQAKSFDRSLDLPARFLYVGEKHPSHTEILFWMCTLFEILRHRVIVCAGKFATQVAVPGVEQFPVFGYEHMNIKPFPVHVMISSIEMPAPFRGLVLNQCTVRQNRPYVVSVSDHSRRVRILSTYPLQELNREIMRVTVDIHFSALHRDYLIENTSDEV